jgi:beta-lactam-binding protein with PASTA domain
VVQLPNFQSQLAADVVAVLEAVGLKVETEYSSHPKIPQGAIITHEPTGGVMVKTGDRVLLEISGVQGTTENISRPLTFTHTVSEEGKLSRHVKIVIIDEYSERIEVDQRYAPGTVIDLEQKGVRVFGKTRVIVYENDEKLPEVVYR